MIENRIVAFHIGRGGRFNNQGFLRFIGEKKIGEFIDHLFERHEGLGKLRDAIGDRENIVEKFEDCIGNNDFTFFEKLGFDLGEKVYFDCNGNEVGLSEADVQSGIGFINEDNDYDSTYTCYLKDCGSEELKLILNYSGWVDSDILDYCKENLGTENE